MSPSVRAVTLAAGLFAVSGLEVASQAWPGASVRASARRNDAPRRLVLADQARRFLELSQSSPLEFLGCMIGDVWGGVVVVRSISPADVDPSHSTPTWVVSRRSCESAGWTGTVGMVHSHPTAERCWYSYPRTEVLNSDGVSFLMTPYAVDAIMCGERLVWVNRALVERELPLSLPRSPE